MLQAFLHTIICQRIFLFHLISLRCQPSIHSRYLQNRRISRPSIQRSSYLQRHRKTRTVSLKTTEFRFKILRQSSLLYFDFFLIIKKKLVKAIPYVCGIPGPIPMASIAPKSPLSIDFTKLLPSFDVEAPSVFNYPHPIQPATFNAISMNRMPTEYPRRPTHATPLSDADTYSALAGKTNHFETGVIRSRDHRSPEPLQLKTSRSLNRVFTPKSGNEKPFNFARMGENLSMSGGTRSDSTSSASSASSASSGSSSTTHSDGAKSAKNNFNCDETIEIKVTVPRIEVNDMNADAAPDPVQSTTRTLTLTIKTPEPVAMSPAHAMDADSGEPSSSVKPPKFVRPTSLPLKPGTFTPKRHHGITPTANTLPLISPETPRPSKNCVQLYLNGHAYTYLGLKCSTKTFFCTLNRPQPAHFINEPKSSSYSNWQICKNGSQEQLSSYDSRQNHEQHWGKYTIAGRSNYTTLHSQSLICASAKAADHDTTSTSDATSVKVNTSVTDTTVSTPVPQDLSISMGAPKIATADEALVHKSAHGRFVCSKCGARCRDSSVIKKYAGDDRPFMCQLCQNG